MTRIVFSEMERQKSSSVLQKEYGISRTTAWRGKRRGWVVLDYRKREIKMDMNWAAKNTGMILEQAAIGAGWALKILNMPRNGKSYDFCDLAQEAVVRILELSGHPSRKFPRWLATVGRNAVLSFLKYHWRAEREENLPENDKGESLLEGENV